MFLQKVVTLLCVFEGSVTKSTSFFSGGTSRDRLVPRTATTGLLSYWSQNPIMLEACLGNDPREEPKHDLEIIRYNML